MSGVSTKDQNEDRQYIALRELCIPEENIFYGQAIRKGFCAASVPQVGTAAEKDDLLYVKSIDRLGRNYTEILEQWRILTKEKGADIVVLDMPLLDTRRGKDLMGTFLSDIVLQVLSFVAENGRSNIRQRQAEGIAAAKARGSLRKTAASAAGEFSGGIPGLAGQTDYAEAGSPSMPDARRDILCKSGPRGDTDRQMRRFHNVYLF